MTAARIPRRVSAALVNSLSAGVVPRTGLEYVAVGRKDEVEALLRDLETVADGGGAFRLVTGKYGSGKSFMLQLVRAHALERDFAVADADLSPERRLAGSDRQGLATYRELLKNLSTRSRPDGGSLGALLERWIGNLQADAARELGLRPGDPGFAAAVEARMLGAVANMRGMVHGFDFATVVTAYWRGHMDGDDARREAALRWLRGEYSTKTEAREALGVRSIVDDDSWYDHLKLVARFAADVGLKGLIVLIDEAVNLYKISHSVSREANYEKLLAMFNDTMQGKAEHLGLLVGGTPQFLEDPRRGLYSYEALRSRLAENRFAREGARDTTGPVLRLPTLTHDELFVLLTRVTAVHAAHYGHALQIAPTEYELFLQEELDRLGAEVLLTPREVVRDFLGALNLATQPPGRSLARVLRGPDFKPGAAARDPDSEPDAAEFTL